MGSVVLSEMYLCTCFLSGPAESDMSLVMLTEESDSDSESSHSNQDNVSVQRSAVTMATAGSDAGGSILVNYSIFGFINIFATKQCLGIVEVIIDT